MSAGQGCPVWLTDVDVGTQLDLATALDAPIPTVVLVGLEQRCAEPFVAPFILHNLTTVAASASPKHGFFQSWAGTVSQL